MAMPYYGPQPSYGAAGQMLMGPMMGTAGPAYPRMPATFKGERLAPPIAKPPAKKVSVPALIATVLVPWLIFAIVFYVRALWLRYSYPMLSLCLALYFLIFVLVAGVMAFSAARDPNQGDIRVLGLVFLLCALAWGTAWGAGDNIFTNYTGPYYDVTNLNEYPSVDPTTVAGTRLMDAGIIEFSEKANLDTSKAVGFKDGHMYCVAPVTMPGYTEDHFDFWAVGIDCCTGRTAAGSQGPSFFCGEYNVPGIHKGLRLMDDSQRPFFRLAVKEAEAAYNVKAGHPVFVHWMSDPHAETDAYQEDAFRYFTFGIFSFFGVLVFIAVSAGIVFNLSS